MEDPESILQLGIDAAREDNKEEARNLFRLLTRQDPGNAQAWLWLAGVAETREERIAALERVLEIEPNNEMAKKGLQGMQRGAAPAVAAVAAAAPKPVAPPAPPAPPAPAKPAPPPDLDDPFAELDALSDVIASGPVAVRREQPESDPFGDEFDQAMADSPSAARPAPERKRTEPLPSGATSSASSSSSSAAWRGGSNNRGNKPARNDQRGRSGRSLNEENDPAVTKPARRSPLLLFLLGTLLVFALLFVVFNLFFRGDRTADVAEPIPTATSEAYPGPAAGGPTVEPPTTEAPATEAPATEAPATEAPATEAPVTEAPATEAPATEAPPAFDPAAANPVPVAPGTALQVAGLSYNFIVPNYATSFPGPVGAIQPQGRWALVLILVTNTSGQAQTIPADFFLLKDAQGRVYQANPAASSAYVIPGANADQSQETAIAADGLQRSIPLLFDVAPDATNLVFFAKDNPGQGYTVLAAVQ